LCATCASAQNSLDVLEQDLNQVKQEHQEATSKTVVDLLDQLDAAYQSSTAAVSLYQTAGGTMPEPTPVTTRNAYETPDEKSVRLEQDQTNISNLAYALQMHCGLMRYALLFITQPNQKGLKDDWIAWLKTAAQIYPNLKQKQEQKQDQDEEGKNVVPHGGENGKGGWRAVRQAAAHEAEGPDYQNIAVRDSIISTYFGFHGWGDKEQGSWTVRDIPNLYRKNILDPLRVSPSAQTLAAWDAYIAMKNVDQPDNDKWNEVDYPTLEFDRGCDDFAIARSTEKLATLVALIKANPTHPQLDDWIARVHKMMQDYRAQKAGGAVAPSTIPSSAPADTSDSTSTSSDPAKS